MVKKKTNFTEDEFNLAKTLLDNGLSRSQVKDVLGGRSNPIYLIEKHKPETYTEYKQVLKRVRAEWLATREAARKEEPNPAEQANVDVAQEMLVLAEQYKPAEQGEVTLADINTTLVAINNSLEALVEAWQNKPKRSIF